MGVVKVIVNGDTKMDITPTTADANEVNQGEVFFNRSGEQSVGTGYPPSTRVPVYGMGKNQIDNWYFVGGGSAGVFPVNQRGASSYTQGAGTLKVFDRWNLIRGTAVLASGGVNLSWGGSETGGTVGTLRQFIGGTPFTGYTCTFSLLYGNGNMLSFTMDMTASINQYSIQQDGLQLHVLISSGNTLLDINYGSTTSVTLVAAKFELGSEQTLCHNEGTEANPVWVLNEVPDYEEELLKCQTSTADSTDTYANKSVATEQQIAYVENGTTASRAYSVGEYFCKGGLLYQVTAAISSGGTITPGTNCESKTVAGEIDARCRMMTVVASGGQSVDIIINGTNYAPFHSAIISCTGNSTAVMAVYLVNGLGIRDSYRMITKLTTSGGASVSVTMESGKYIITNNSSSYSMIVTVSILQEVDGTLSLSTPY